MKKRALSLALSLLMIAPAVYADMPAEVKYGRMNYINNFADSGNTGVESDRIDAESSKNMETLSTKLVVLYDSEIQKIKSLYPVREGSLISAIKINPNAYDFNSPFEIAKFQAYVNVEVTKIVDGQTKKFTSSPFAYSIDVIPQQLANGYSIVVNKSRKSLTVYKEGRIFSKNAVGIGRVNAQTPSGKRTVISKLVNPVYYGENNHNYTAGGSPHNPLGKRWMGIGQSYGIHGNSSEKSIGGYVSAGCIRMYNSEVEQLYDYIPIGTKVWIGTTEELASWGIEQYSRAEL